MNKVLLMGLGIVLLSNTASAGKTASDSEAQINRYKEDKNTVVAIFNMVAQRVEGYLREHSTKLSLPRIDDDDNPKKIQSAIDQINASKNKISVSTLGTMDAFEGENSLIGLLKRFQILDSKIRQAAQAAQHANISAGVKKAAAHGSQTAGSLNQ